MNYVRNSSDFKQTISSLADLLGFGRKFSLTVFNVGVSEKDNCEAVSIQLTLQRNKKKTAKHKSPSTVARDRKRREMHQRSQEPQLHGISSSLPSRTVSSQGDQVPQSPVLVPPQVEPRLHNNNEISRPHSNPEQDPDASPGVLEDTNSVEVKADGSRSGKRKKQPSPVKPKEKYDGEDYSVMAVTDGLRRLWLAGSGRHRVPARTNTEINQAARDVTKYVLSKVRTVWPPGVISGLDAAAYLLTTEWTKKWTDPILKHLRIATSDLDSSNLKRTRRKLSLGDSQRT